MPSGTAVPIRSTSTHESGGKADRTEFKALLVEAYQQKFAWPSSGGSTALAARVPWPHYLKELKDHGVNYTSFTEPYLDSLGPFGDVIVSMLATIAAQDLVNISENTKAALAKKKAAGVQLGALTKGEEVIGQVRRLKVGGACNQAIARALKMSPNTVAKYLATQSPDTE